MAANPNTEGEPWKPRSTGRCGKPLHVRAPDPRGGAKSALRTQPVAIRYLLRYPPQVPFAATLPGAMTLIVEASKAGSSLA